MDEERKPLVALDIQIPADTPVGSAGVAYYRLTKEMRDFLNLCEQKHGVLGFEYDGSFNFGVILRNPAKEA